MTKKTPKYKQVVKLLSRLQTKPKDAFFLKKQNDRQLSNRNYDGIGALRGARGGTPGGLGGIGGPLWKPKGGGRGGPAP